MANEGIITDSFRIYVNYLPSFIFLFIKPSCHLVDKGKDYIEMDKCIYIYFISEVMCHQSFKVYGREIL